MHSDPFENHPPKPGPDGMACDALFIIAHEETPSTE